MTVLYALVLKSRLARDPQSARFLTNAESAWLAARLSHGAENEDTRRLSGPAVMWEVARDWRVLYLAVTWVLAASSMFGIMFWAPLLIRELIGGPRRGLLEEPEAFCGERGHASSSALVALLTTVPYAAAAVSTVVVAHHADLRRERRRHAGVPLVVGGLFLAATPLVRRGLGPAAGFACLVLAAGVTWGFQGPFFTGGSAGSAGFALINSVGSLGGFLGPYAIGLITQRAPGGLAAPMLFMAGLLLAAGVAVLLFPVPDQRPQLSSSSDVECARLVGQEDDEDSAPAVADDSPTQSLDREIEPPRLAPRARQR
ncbi:hypothetical protein QBZ16_000016 [Prototheca wickerhamii]|uniref:Uncharacterized protein n=1 Tax=Prototheca wickerhamii TaxID=3111 RepID=A0AAD9MMT8_PROWI|nr:hypothetical protein QBZ16_000016 [Prototheca wickerhamii]